MNTNNCMLDDDCESSLRIEKVRSLLPGAHVYVAGICGTGTSAVAFLLKQLGFRVSGSDKAFYPPIGEKIREIADAVYEGYSAENLQEQPDLVVIGNSLSRNNPEVVHVLENNIPYASMPEVFSALLIGTREQCPTSVVAAGTHGKTTTSSLIATMFDVAGREPAYFIGGICENLPGNIRPLTQSIPLAERVVVLEGDEYDSAFFAKWPKFLSYRPDVLVLTSLEFDHADIYQSVEEIEAEFEKLLRIIPENGLALLCDVQPRLKELGLNWKSKGILKSKLCMYGEAEDSPFRLLSREVLEDDTGFAQRLKLLLQGEELIVRTRSYGLHNALNILAAAAVGQHAGLSKEEIVKGLEAYKGVLRRQQVVKEVAGVSIVLDFAHHPTAVNTTLKGFSEQFPEKRLIAVFEPRSNTSKRHFFQEDYARSFDAADLVLIKEVKDPGSYSKQGNTIQALDVPRLAEEISERGTAAYSFDNVSEIVTYLSRETKPNDLLLLMSNGDFEGLLPLLLEKLK